MSHSLVKKGYQQAKKLLLIQMIIIILMTSLGLFKEFKIAIALLSGGMAVLLANVYFTYKAFSKSGAQQVKNIVSAFYFGATVKMVLSATILVVGLVFLPGLEVYVLVGYVVALISQWLTPVIIKGY